jgi:invasion protein IalB
MLQAPIFAFRAREAVSAITPYARCRKSRRLSTALVLIAGAGFGIEAPWVSAYATQIEKVKEFGDWTMYCEKDKGSRCTLVQSVSAETDADPRAWVKAGIQSDDSGSLTFKFRIERSARLEPGVGVRIDQKQVGVAVPFRCEENYCEAGISVSNATQPNEFGVELLTGKEMAFDILFTDKQGVNGYRVPLNLSSLKDGVAELTFRQYQQEIARNEFTDPRPSGNAPRASWNFLAERGQKQEFVVVSTSWNLDGSAKTTDKYQTSDDKQYATACTVRDPSGAEKVLSTNVAVGNDLTLLNDDQHKLQELIRDAKDCGAGRLFVIKDTPDTGQGNGISFFERVAKKLTLAKALQEEGVPKDHIRSTDSGGNLLIDLPPTIGDNLTIGNKR